MMTALIIGLIVFIGGALCYIGNILWMMRQDRKEMEEWRRKNS